MPLSSESRGIMWSPAVDAMFNAHIQTELVLKAFSSGAITKPYHNQDRSIYSWITFSQLNHQIDRRQEKKLTTTTTKADEIECAKEKNEEKESKGEVNGNLEPIESVDNVLLKSFMTSIDL